MLSSREESSGPQLEPKNTTTVLIGEQERGTEEPAGAVSNDEPPDGGWVAWSQIIPAHIANIMSWGYGTGFSVFQLYYKQTMDLPASQISWIGSSQIFLCFAVGMVSGRLSDAGYPRHLYAIGAIISIFAMFMTSLTNTYWQIILAQGICQGIGAGLMFMPATANSATYFKKKRSLAMSLNGCGSSSGAILYPAIIQFLTPKVGFPWAVRICGFISIALAIVGFYFLKPRKLHRAPAPLLDIKAFKNVPYATFTGGAFLIYFCLFTMLIYINSFARQVIGLSDLESINFVLITNAVAIPARPLFGLIADRYDASIETYGLNCVTLGIMAFCWIGVHTRGGMYAFSVAMGFVNGAAQGIFSSAISRFITDPSKMGTWIGMTFGICGVATLAGPPTMGAIIDASGSKYIWAQIWVGLTIFMGGSIVLFAAWLIKKKSGNINTASNQGP
ncbi:MFS general substrate transporter [Daldinia sp. FL1419]|nr:MFS general substrate transporter [Daldinia sp. FL1419]